MHTYGVINNLSSSSYQLQHHHHVRLRKLYDTMIQYTPHKCVLQHTVPYTILLNTINNNNVLLSYNHIMLSSMIIIINVTVLCYHTIVR